MKRSITAFVITSAALAHLGVARADETAADALERGQHARKLGRVHQACEAFEQSDKLEAKVETELLLADCYVEDGKPVTAARLYRALADKAADAARRKAWLAKAAKLEAKAPKLRFAINPRPDGLVVEVDGAEVASSGDVRVDIGPHEVVATAPGFEGHAAAAVDGDRPTVDVIIRMEPRAAEPNPRPQPAAPPAQTAPPPARAQMPATELPPPVDERNADHRRRNGLIIGGAGVGLAIGAGVLGLISQSKFDDEHALCPHFQCKTAGDVPRASSLQSDAKTYRGLAIGVGIGAAAAVGVGAYLLLTPHKAESHVAFQVEHGGGDLVFTSRF